MARLYAPVVMMFIIMTTVQLKPTEPDNVRSLLITLLKKELRNEQRQGQGEKSMELDDKEYGSDEDEEPTVQPSGSAEEDAKNDSAGYTGSKYLSDQLDDKTRQYMDKQLMIKSKRNLLDLQSTCTRNHNLRNQVTGSIQSTNFPDDYEDNLDDCWTIGKENQAVNITFSQEFSIEPGASCPWDSLTIYEAGSGEPVLGPYCGRHAPESIVVHTPALVHFHTDNSIAWTGFQAHFTKTCPTYDDHGSGSITSHPGYGSSTYPHRYNTCWMIGDETTSVDLTFASFRLENHSRCAYDHLAFYTLQDGTFTQEGDSLCGTSLPDPQHFQRGPVKLEFRTDGSVAYQGFQIDYVIEPA